MKPTPVCVVEERIKPFSLIQQIHHINALIMVAKQNNWPRNELISLLAKKRTEQLQRANLQSRERKTA